MFLSFKYYFFLILIYYFYNKTNFTNLKNYGFYKQIEQIKVFL